MICQARLGTGVKPSVFARVTRIHSGPGARPRSRGSRGGDIMSRGLTLKRFQKKNPVSASSPLDPFVSTGLPLRRRNFRSSDTLFSQRLQRWPTPGSPMASSLALESGLMSTTDYPLSVVTGPPPLTLLSLTAVPALVEYPQLIFCQLAHADDISGALHIYFKISTRCGSF